MKSLLIYCSMRIIRLTGIHGAKKLLRKRRQKTSLYFYLLGTADWSQLRTCHYCHVMAHESFEDDEVAQILNRGFISIKVDREERPDIDAVYMSVCQAITGAGGWPLTIIMTPEKTPFFAGTYFPKRQRHGSPGITELLLFVEKSWKQEREALLAEGQKITEFLKARQASGERSSRSLPEDFLKEAVRYYTAAFDPKWGGFGAAPKFPSPHNLLFLMQQGEKACMDMAEKTLLQMYQGGIFDHIGGGFCRYSTDEKWLVPHFEKMLYDNALLLLAYARAFRLTENPVFWQAAERTAAYVLRELTHDEGGFFCSQDADSDGIEGKYYVFMPGEIKSALGEKKGEAFCRRFHITERGNFEGRSIPNLIGDPALEVQEQPDTLRTLDIFRKQRTNLHRDDKILTGWNGLMIAAFALAARELKKLEYEEKAIQAADFVWSRLHQGKGKLLTRWRQGAADFLGTLEDYAFYAWGLLECYRTTLDIVFLERAVCVSDEMLRQFFDPEEGGCFLYGKDSEQLFVRPKDIYDGAMPSGNSVAALVMKKLAFLTGSEKWRKAWELQERYMRENLQHPAAASFFLWVLTQEMEDKGQLICSTSERGIKQELAGLDMDILLKTDENLEQAEKLAPFLKDYPIPKVGSDFYFCKGHTCSALVHSLKELGKISK